MTSITYAMSVSDYKKYFNKDSKGYDDDDDFLTLEVECIDEPTDRVAEYSIKWINNDNDENGIINNLYQLNKDKYKNYLKIYLIFIYSNNYD